MISISQTTALMLYFSITLICTLSFWGYHHYKTRQKKMVVSEDGLFICEYCHFAYLADLTKKVNQCPECKSYNKDNKFIHK